MIDFIVKSMKNQLDNHAEITHAEYLSIDFITERINRNIHCKIHKKSLSDCAHDFSIVNPV